MEKPLAHLLNLLEDEFRSFPDVRVRVAQKAGTTRSPDLPQDYDTESNDLHLRQGVIVQTKRAQYYFPEAWAQNQDYAKINSLVDEIRDKISR